MSREGRPTRPGQLAADALRWAAGDDPYPPESIAALSTHDQAELARAAHGITRAVRDAVARAASNGQGD